MSIAELIVDDPAAGAALLGIPFEDLLCDYLGADPEDLRGFRRDTSTKQQDFEKCRKLPWARAFPSLILDDADSFDYSTHALLGNGSSGDPDTAAFWKASGALRVDLRNDQLIRKLVKSKVFTSIVIGGDVDASEQKFKTEVVPLLRPFVLAGGILIIQNGARWSTYAEAFAEEINWTSGGIARVFGVHKPNRQQVMRLFPIEANKTSEIRGKAASF